MTYSYKGRRWRNKNKVMSLGREVKRATELPGHQEIDRDGQRREKSMLGWGKL